MAEVNARGDFGWPAAIVVLAGVVPILAVHLAYMLNLFAGDGLEARFTCMPYAEGCVSVSRAARSGPGLHLFRALVLPGSMLLLLSWALAGAWLRAMACSTPKRIRAMTSLGVFGALFLVPYATWLGTDGEWYSWLRRYGVIFYFAGTALAQLLLLRELWPVRCSLATGRLRKWILVLAALVVTQWVLGVLSPFKRLLSDPVLMDRVENVIEWWFALAMSLGFIVMARLLSLSGFRFRLEVDTD